MICNFTEGDAVPIPTFPFLSTMNEVAVELPIMKGITPADEPIESRPVGVVVAMPKELRTSSEVVYIFLYRN